MDRTNCGTPGYLSTLYTQRIWRGRSFFDLKTGAVLLYLVLLLLISTACTSNTSTTRPQATGKASQPTSPTPAPRPAGQILFQSNFSHGLAGWKQANGWKITANQLESDASGTGSFTIPYQPAKLNFAVEIRIQIVRLIQKNGGFFMLSTPASGPKDGYQCGVANLKGSQNRPNGDHPQAQAFLLPNSDITSGTGLPIDYEPGSGWRVYRVEVRDGSVSLRIDGVQVGMASSAQSRGTSTGQIEFTSDQVILHVSEIKVVTL